MKNKNTCELNENRECFFLSVLTEILNDTKSAKQKIFLKICYTLEIKRIHKGE